MLRTLLFGLGLTLLACRTGHDPGITNVPRGQDPSDPSTGVRIQLGLGQSATVGDGRHQIVFTAVPEDSRCPANVQCIWTGNGRVRLDLVDSRERITQISLNTTTEPRGINVDGLRIDLVDLRPYPQEPQPLPPDVYSVVLSVKTR
jgi:hypothetical protein